MRPVLRIYSNKYYIRGLFYPVIFTCDEQGTENKFVESRTMNDAMMRMLVMVFSTVVRVLRNRCGSTPTGFKRQSLAARPC